MNNEKPGIQRIVPNIYSNDLAKSKLFYKDFLGLTEVMDLGWIVTFAASTNPMLQISILKNDTSKELNNEFVFLSVEVSDIDELYKKAQDLNIPVTYKITDEPWGVRRFFVEDPNGATINLLSHPKKVL